MQPVIFLVTEALLSEGIGFKSQPELLRYHSTY